jgi:hypothetical protein
MPGHRDRRRHQRTDPSTWWTARGSDPAAGPSPDPLTPAPPLARGSAAHRTARSNRSTSTRRPAPAPPPVLVRGKAARARRGRAVRRRRGRRVGRLLFLPFRRVLVSYVRALLRALLPWLLPLALLAALPHILALLGGH